MGGTPNEILADEDLMDYFEPILRADFEAVETYTYLPKEPIDVPISVLYGLNEGLSEKAVNCWQEETKKKVKIIGMSGNHFFIFKHSKKIANYLSRALFS